MFPYLIFQMRVWVQQNIAVDKKVYGYISFEDSFVNERSDQNTYSETISNIIASISSIPSYVRA